MTKSMQTSGVLKFVSYASVIFILSVFGTSANQNVTFPGNRRADAVLGGPLNTRLSGHAYRRIVGTSRLQCGAKCAGNATGCLSFNYCKDGRVCELNNAEAARYPQDLTHEESCGYYDISARSECGMVTDTTYYHRFLPAVADVRKIEFRVQASNDASISLSPTLPADPQTSYEVVFGSSVNRYALIRRCVKCTDKVQEFVPDVLSGSQFRGFWVTFDFQTGKLAAGKEGQDAPLVQWVDSNPLDVKYVGFSTCCGSTGIFRYSCTM